MHKKRRARLLIFLRPFVGCFNRSWLFGDLCVRGDNVSGAKTQAVQVNSPGQVGLDMALNVEESGQAQIPEHFNRLLVPFGVTMNGTLLR